MRKASKVCFSTKMNIIPPAPLSDLLPVHLFVQLFRSEPVRGTEQVSCQTRLPWVKMAGEVLLYPPPPPPPPQPSLSYSLVQHGKVASYSRLFHKFCDHILSKHRKERKRRGLSSWRLGSGWLMLLPRSRMTTKGPPTPTALPMAFPFPVSV